MWVTLYITTIKIARCRVSYTIFSIKSYSVYSSSFHSLVAMNSDPPTLRSISDVIYHIFIKFISWLYPDIPILIPTSDYMTSLIISYSLVFIFTCFYDSYLFCSCFQYFWFLATSYILHSSCMLRCFCMICSELLWHSTPVLCSLFDYDPIRLISITIPIRPDLV